MSQTGKRLSPRVSLVVIAALFLLPLAAAWLMYSGVIDFEPGDTRNLGELVEPPVPVDLDGLVPADPARDPTTELPRHWAIVHVVPADCGPDCEATVTALRQVYVAAGRNQSRLRILLLAVLGLFAVLSIDALYLAAITLAEHLSGEVYQNYFYQLMFLLHLVLGLGLIVPALVFAGVHLARTWRRPRKRLPTWSPTGAMRCAECFRQCWP